jgi:hypothetical protein
MSFAYKSGRSKPVRVSEKDYFLSGDWKCPESPTGAHWWNCNVEPQVCKICGKVKVHAELPG